MARRRGLGTGGRAARKARTHKPVKKAMAHPAAKKAANKPAGKAKPAAKGKATPKGKFLLATKGRRKNTTNNARAGKSFVTTASKKKGFVQHVYNIKGKRVVVQVKKKGAKAAKAPVSGGRKRKPKGPGGGQFSK